MYRHGTGCFYTNLTYLFPLHLIVCFSVSFPFVPKKMFSNVFCLFLFFDFFSFFRRLFFRHDDHSYHYQFHFSLCLRAERDHPQDSPPQRRCFLPVVAAEVRYVPLQLKHNYDFRHNMFIFTLNHDLSLTLTQESQ